MDLLHILLKNDLSKTVATTICKLGVEVEFDLITNKSTSHRKDLGLFHFGLDFSHVANPVLLYRQVDLPAIWQLHPKSLELLSITVTFWSKLNFWLGCAGHTDAKQTVSCASSAAEHIVERVHGSHWLRLSGRLVRRGDGRASQQVIDALHCCRLVGRCWRPQTQQVISCRGSRGGCRRRGRPQANQILHRLLLRRCRDSSAIGGIAEQIGRLIRVTFLITFSGCFTGSSSSFALALGEVLLLRGERVLELCLLEEALGGLLVDDRE